MIKLKTFGIEWESMRIPPIIICLETFDLLSETVNNSQNCVPDSSCEKKFNIQKV